MKDNNQIFKIYNLDTYEKLLFAETLIKQQQAYIKDLLVYQGKLQAQIDELNFRLGKTPDDGIISLLKTLYRYGLTRKQIKKAIRLSGEAYIRRVNRGDFFVKKKPVSKILNKKKPL